ncbi:2-dehydro-3-deoxygalactonokinase [Leminorella grimontii]|uniref:2-dehydro-3-deoxygalactonokinase n=1 Tax=Leminorella grimontii TaxID=82981 RepID=A0AAV5N0T3_9GAMM|nr:2-dehydro-3-deoxygalactonokinase [Leminorella grimontii]KFC93579.1 2-dehydro-3-deoxygalactonokinase [Leminorella grimontii ATCC 33999 = DSM 5078]GKX55725.1 2-dehydro-3-deoxygalactonokinase [Leminorella grimontii]VFS55284.1 2-keto-3-deoxy-galactonokinase [Leminorella grimontii]
MLIVTIDSGTTNTRVKVWKNGEVIASASESVGVRDTAKTGSPEALIKGIRKTLEAALATVDEQDKRSITMVASGMITSDVGLCHIPHLTAPVSLGALAQGAVARVIPEISDSPIWFIPGVKNAVEAVSLDNCDGMDVMRGEEVETFGLLAAHGVRGPALLVLPGSHSKFIRIDEEQRIAGCATTVAGELLDVLTHQTILANSLEHRFADDIDDEYLLKGADACRDVGIARSCFSVRILDLFTSASVNQRANFLLGAVLYSDLLAIKNSRALALTPSTTVVVSGKAIMKEALARLIERDPFFRGELVLVDEDARRPLSGLGAIEVMKAIAGADGVAALRAAP